MHEMGLSEMRKGFVMEGEPFDPRADQVAYLQDLRDGLAWVSRLRHLEGGFGPHSYFVELESDLEIGSCHRDCCLILEVCP